MPVENKVNSLKRSYPEDVEDNVGQQIKETDCVLKNVVSALESNGKSQDVKTSPSHLASTEEKGSVPPPNTPSTRD